MVLVPEFFTLLGIVVFIGLSFVSWLLDDHLPRLLPYTFQGAAAAGLAALLLSQGLANNGSLPSTISPTRVWISVLYLTAAVSSLAGLNIYLLTTRRQTTQTSILSGFVTGPTLLVSAVLVSSYLGTGGQASLEPATVMVLALLGFGISFGLPKFLAEASRRSSIPRIKRTIAPIMPTTQPSTSFTVSLPSFTSTKTEDGWETAPQKKDEDR